MGLFSKARNFAVRNVATGYGQKWRSDMPVFLTAHKAKIGAAFLLAWGWASSQSCPLVMGIDLLSYLHMSCETVNSILLAIGSFGIGSGLLNSDALQKQKIQAAKVTEAVDGAAAAVVIKAADDVKKENQ